MRTSFAPFLFAVASLAALGCNSSVTDGAGGGGGEGEGGGGGGGPDQCVAFEDPPDLIVQSVTVRFVNEGATDLFLGDPQESCDGFSLFSLETAGGDPREPALGICGFTCGELMTGGCACPAVCAQPLVVRVAPGGTYETSWTGIVYEPATLPEACIGEDGCAGSCFLPGAPDETLTVSAEAFPGPNCDDCTCTPDANGSCILDSATSVTGTPVAATTSFTHDGNAGNVIELVFE